MDEGATLRSPGLPSCVLTVDADIVNVPSPVAPGERFITALGRYVLTLMAAHVLSDHEVRTLLTTDAGLATGTTGGGARAAAAHPASRRPHPPPRLPVDARAAPPMADHDQSPPGDDQE